ncbi:unnamed protein product, partial [Linum tenue]
GLLVWCFCEKLRSESGSLINSWSQQQVKLPHDLNFPSRLKGKRGEKS